MKPTEFPFAYPEEEGVRSSAIRHFLESVDKKGLELHSFILLRHGTKIAQGWWEPYQEEYPHQLYSLSKSFTSSAVGFSVSEGLISIDDCVVSFFPDELPEIVSRNLSAMRISHLLTMSTGHNVDTTERMRAQPEGNWIKGFLSLPVENPPGSPFVYNSGATYMLSAILQKVTGMTVLDYLLPRLFEPLGIQTPTWELCPRGICTGGWGLNIKTEDIARFGQLYLQKGIWEGKRILPESWIEVATGARVANGDNPKSDWNQGYGYQFWRCRHNAYRGDGAFGQFCIVLPEQDAVVAITGGVGNMQAVLNLVWRYLLPGMENHPFRINMNAWKRLESKLNCLKLPRPVGEISSPLQDKIRGVKYLFDENILLFNSIRFDYQEDEQIRLEIGYSQGKDSISFGLRKHIRGSTRLFSISGEENPVVAFAAWSQPDLLVLMLRYIFTPFCWTITCHFNGDSISMEPVTNVSFGPLPTQKLTGKKEGNN